MTCFFLLAYSTFSADAQAAMFTVNGTNFSERPMMNTILGHRLEAIFDRSSFLSRGAYIYPLGALVMAAFLGIATISVIRAGG